LSQDISEMEKHAAALDEIADDDREPTDSSMFAGLSELLGPAAAALLVEFQKPASADDVRKTLTALQQVENIAQVEHRKSLAETRGVYEKNAAIIENNPDILAIAHEDEEELRSALRLRTGQELYWVLKDLHEFLFVVTGSQIQLA